MHDLNDLYYFVAVVDHGGPPPPAGRWACRSRG
jgi:DNA-binding transcriptional LysR family regulator